ncbi:MAG: cell surface protein SprA [Chitinophagales bacterium]|nr:cell surface protein SprA [Chitinophagales bacterium]MDW8393135.1 cell surface protein SprA [Chitinophagales bacterium]
MSRSNGIVIGSLLAAFAAATVLSATVSRSGPQAAPPGVQADSPPGPQLRYPIHDRYSDYYTTPDNHSFDLKDPSAIEQQIEFDPLTGQYLLTETIGNDFFRNPSYLTFEEFLELEFKKQEGDYWRKRSNASALLSEQGILPEVNVNNRLVDRIFGGTRVDIRPQGNIDLTFGGNYQNILNPTLTKRQRRQGGFDFDMQIQMNVLAKIGDKLRMNVNYNTGANFSFENQVKLEYTGYQDEIIRKIEAGNVALPLKGSLITGSQNLFGLKTQLQFGRLTVTSVISQQQSKSQSITLEGGAQTQNFRISCDRYDENRNFFLGQYFYEEFNNAMAQIPIINSQVSITRIEVWVTNKTGVTTDVRNIVAFADLGEYQPYNQLTCAGNPVNRLPYGYHPPVDGPDLNSNNLYQRLTQDPALSRARLLDYSLQTLTENQFLPFQDFEKTYARKLAPNEYTLEPQLGYLLLNQQLQPDEVLGVAYQYTVNGRLYQVGEFSTDITPDADSAKVLFVKMLKSTSTRPKLPIWNLMMKNVYSLGAFQINPEDFYLDIYYLDPGGGEKRYLPADELSGKPLISVLGLDRLNNNLDPQPDGVFDFIPNLTIIPSNGKVIFPVVQPFGKDLRSKFSNPLQAQQYVYQQLYDSTKTVAEQFPQFNRYVLKGTYKSRTSNEIFLGAFNVPQGSVSVTAGGQKLTENVDYTVDYNLGRVRIINQSLLNSGIPINVSFENTDLFSFQTQTLFGTRLDYYINRNLSLGGTLLKLWERPYTNKLNAGYDPISNAIYGLDGTYQKELPVLTRWVNALPLIETTGSSSLSITAEGARLDPGHSRVIGPEGTIYIDDFEGTQTSYDLRFPFISWKLASTPQVAQFPEATRVNNWSYGFNRSKLSWYQIDPFFWSNQAPDGIKNNSAQQSNFYSREVLQTEIFPEKDLTNTPFDQRENTFDLRYEPRKRGPYNFDTTGLILLPDGTIGFDTTSAANLRKRWAGIQRSLDQTDFEQANIEYIQLWLLDPFLYDQNSTGGNLFIDLGNISEDLLKDSKFFYENGLSPSGDTTIMNRTQWGFSPKLPPVTNAFDTDPNARQWQDVGYDGVRSTTTVAGTSSEQQVYARYLDALAQLYGVNSPLYQAALADPAADDYRYYDDGYPATVGILDRYNRFNNPEGNSPVSSATAIISQAATNAPESEDLNRDNTITENEEFFQYQIRLRPNMIVGDRFVTDVREYQVPPDRNGFSPGIARWIQIKIPISEFSNKVGSIQDFKSIRFVRMYLTDFDTTVILRFARMELVRNQWRKYLYSLESPGEYLPGDNSDVTTFNVTSVSLEENSTRAPVNYVMPPGILREQIVGQLGTQFQNEQSLSLQVCHLRNGDARAVYKNINLDLRQYHNVKVFVHAEAIEGQGTLNYGDLWAFVRLGSDFTNNYYEYAIPLVVTPPGSYNPNSPTEQRKVWPDENNIHIVLRDLVAIKSTRNQQSWPVNQPYTVDLPNGGRITVMGNPDLGNVVTAMLGVRNPKDGSVDDDGQPKCAEVWFDEFRLTGFNEDGGNAALARAEIRLADLGNVALSTSYHSIGFGQLQQKLNERYRDNFFAYDLGTTIELGKLAPEKIGLRLPFFAGISKSISTPQYDPYDQDILLEDKLRLIENGQQRSEARKAAQTYTSIGSINFTNVRLQPQSKNTKQKIYSPQNWNVTYAYTRTFGRTPIIASNLLRNHRAELGYQFPGKARFLTPLQKAVPAKSKYLKIIRDINFNFLPTNLNFRTVMDRQFGELMLRPLDETEKIIPTYNKFWTWDRLGGFKYEISKGLNVDFNATTRTRIDEPEGRLDSPEKKDSVWRNIMRLGRTTNYNHAANAAYTLPLNKIPLLDWTQNTARYGSTFGWLTGPMIIDPATQKMVITPLGHTINNGQNLSLNSDFNLRNLYAKSKFLKRYDTNAPQQKPRTDAGKGDRGKETPAQEEKKDDAKSGAKKPDQKPIGPEKVVIRMVMMVKKFNISYGDNRTTLLPGFLPRPRLVGQDLALGAPGWPFAFGYQPDSNWLNRAAQRGWISADTALNYQFLQTRQRQLTMKLTAEPFKDVLVDVNFNKTRGDNLSEYFKVPAAGAGFAHLSRMQSGTFTMSYLPIKTTFVRVRPNTFSATFLNFQDYRQIISERLTAINPNSNFEPFGNDTVQGTYYKGYGPYSPDVLLPAFLAAYTGKDPRTIGLGLPFRELPRPNWRITYNGLTKLPWAKKIWNNVNISHGYTSTLAMSSFNQSLLFRGDAGDDLILPSYLDPNSLNFVPFYNIPSVVISEQFSPLIGIDMTWKNSLSTKVEYKKSRNLAFSFLDFQLAESRNEEISLGIGYKFRNVPLPWKVDGKRKFLKNDVNFQFNTSVTDNVTYSQRLDEPVASQPTAGVQTITISPSADYTVNNRLNVRVFFDKRITNPRISASYPIRYTAGGVTLRFSLGQ